MSLAFYRKYRPKRFSDMLGHDAITTVLKNAVSQGRISHAYLFTGVRGTGKTTAARILAKAANCNTLIQNPDPGKEGEPCNTCETCRSVASGQTIDVVEIDAASNRGIDDIRALKEGAQFSPSYLHKKVFIIDEAHALTKDASHALLKLLEEPPAHAMFILATTEPEKLLPTIISRTQRFDFRRLSAHLIQQKLRAIVKEENVAITDDALRFIAHSAEGSLRDAETMLDQAASYRHGLLDVSTLEAMLGRADVRTLKNIVDATLDKDTGRIVSLLRELEEGGYSASEIHKDLVRYMRRLLAITLSPQRAGAYTDAFSEEECLWFTEQSQRADIQMLLRLLTALLEAQKQIRYSPAPMLPIEIAVLDSIAE